MFVDIGGPGPAVSLTACHLLPNMECASLHIQSLPEAVRCTWIPPGGDEISRVRAVHPDDVLSIANTLNSPPPSLAHLETLGRRIFSRLLDREVRQAVFDAPRCHVAITSDLSGIPWELCCSNGRFLADVHSVGFGTNNQFSPGRADLHILLVADPTGDLPWSIGEANEIADRLRHISTANIQILAGASATRDNVLSAIEDRPFDIVHFTCHAEFDVSRPQRSHVCLFDGPLIAEDLYQTNAARPPALCVLNACESGRSGARATVDGLASAFTMAGAGAVLGARWPVNNKCSAYWMSSFYAAVLSGDTLGEAVGLARSNTRRLFAKDPFLTWSAFTLNGAPWQRLVDSQTKAKIGRAPLVGRETQWKALTEAWDDARAGRGNAVALVGPAGSGKSRLLDDLMSFLPPSAVVTNEQLRGAGLSAAVQHARAAGGLALVLDDFDQMPQRDKAAIVSLAQAVAGEPVLIVLAVQSVQSLRQTGEYVRVLPLPPLTGNHLARLFGSLDAEPPPGLHSAYPGEAERIALGLPRGDSAGALADALPELERNVLRAAAVWGDPFDVDDAAALLDTTNDALWRHLERLCTAGWIVEQSPGTFRFRDAEDRQSILNAVRPIGERLALERKAARLCEDAGRCGEAATHWLAADDQVHAVAALCTAIERAEHPDEIIRWHTALLEAGGTQKDPERAAVAYSEVGDWANARKWWESSVQQAGVEAGAVLLRLAQACLHTGDAVTAGQLIEEAIASAPEEDVLAVRAELLLHLGRPEEAMETARAAIKLALEDNSLSVSASASLTFANAALMLARPQEAIAACDAARNWPASTGTRASLSRAAAQAWQYAGDYRAAESEMRHLAQTQSESGLPTERASTLLALAHICRDQGRLAESLNALDEARALAGQFSAVPTRAEAGNVLSSVYRRLGRYDDALDEAESTLATAISAQLAPEAIRARIHIATALTETGSLSTARLVATDAGEAANSAGYLFGSAWAKNVLGLCTLEAGHRNDAHAAFEESLGISRSIHGHIGIASALCNIAWAVWPDAPEAVGSFREAIETAAGISYRAVILPARFGLAMCEGDIPESESVLREIEDLNMGGVVPWLREKRGAWHFSQNRCEAAIQDLAPAYRAARRSGMRALQARAALALAAAYDATGEPAADGLRDEGIGLTALCLTGW